MEVNPVTLSPNEIVDACGGYSLAIEEIMNLNRALWNHEFPIEKSAQKEKSSHFREIREEAFLVGKSEFQCALYRNLMETLRVKSLKMSEPIIREGRFKVSILQPLRFVRYLMGNLRPDADLRYYVMRSIRMHYGCFFSFNVAHFFNLMADATNRLMADGERQFDYSEDFIPQLSRALKGDKVFSSLNGKQLIGLFTECCRAVSFISPFSRMYGIKIRTRMIDAEYLVSHLFGIPTQIPGFNELFGGCGLILSECPGDSFGQDKLTQDDIELDQDPSSVQQTLSLKDDFLDPLGRLTLITGRFGTGKSLLSLHLAVEVARKGGVAWIMPLEQTAHECLYVLESMQILPNDGSVAVVTDPNQVEAILEQRNQETGVLIILKTIKDSYENFLEIFQENSWLLKNYPLRLLCVDPINSIHKIEGDNIKLRGKMVDAIQKMKAFGTNILLVAEKHDDEPVKFEENIADTVIQLSIKESPDYFQRYFEIKKSRLQREQRGIHNFSIISGNGFHISPSTAAVAARIQSREIESPAPSSAIDFGIPSFDSLLPDQALRAGDLIVLNGPKGSFKTQIGAHFLNTKNSGNNDTTASLFVAARDEKPMVLELLKQTLEYDPQMSGKIRVCSLPHGFTTPGAIIQQIEAEFYNAILEGIWIERVFVDDVGYWETACPFIRDDTTFGDTLVHFLRRLKVTSLFACNAAYPDSDSIVQVPIIDSADHLIQFNRFEFRGTSRVNGKLIKTRKVKNQQQMFEIFQKNNRLQIQPISPLIRIEQNGQVTETPIHLIMHAESQMQQAYNANFLNSIKAVFSRAVNIDTPDRFYFNRAVNLGHFSASDELQLLQLDEFQVPNIKDSQTLYNFSLEQWWGTEWGDFEDQMLKKARQKDGFVAIPFYGNISLLAFDKNRASKREVSSWRSIAKRSYEWFKNGQGLFFDFPRKTADNYNCLFFEILLTLKPEVQTQDSKCGLIRWLRSDEAIEAAKIFRQLCRPAYLTNPEGNRHKKIAGQDINGDKDDNSLISVDQNAVVWRHWYSTLNQMLSEMDSEKRKTIEVCGLPKKVATAGEWYLGVPAYSAAPDVALEIIKLLTTHSAELDRLRSGVGLPTRKKFYEPIQGKLSFTTTISPFFSMNLGELRTLMNNPFRRSRFLCYEQFAQSLAHHLKLILEIPDEKQGNLKKPIQNIIGSFMTRISFLSEDEGCKDCPIKGFQNAGI